MSDSIINISIINLGVIIWFYHFWKAKKLEKRIKELENKKQTKEVSK